MLWHYVSTVLPDGFKAQVAATSRLATVRYRDALSARDDLVAEIERLPEDLVAVPLTAASTSRPRSRRQILVRALPQLELIRILDFVPVISGTNNDDPTWAAVDRQGRSGRGHR